ncbi:hypothetical protein BU14_0731s0003 [Porphyra umbilicalis]|uniref:Uncharacterized protein n=1 Tax=Porphyra umbilicalis TaxID=2786 RepID=A0A1X6NPI4_PORUM|nr:hypothetical protein BU14_0731s0003 [Porphyra umbilicalis]|eukprot:OSX70528.1 hypothetical protein BU14_0731s0003 [Porphyra umbilicalis]
MGILPAVTIQGPSKTRLDGDSAGRDDAARISGCRPPTRPPWTVGRPPSPPARPTPPPRRRPPPPRAPAARRAGGPRRRRRRGRRARRVGGAGPPVAILFHPPLVRRRAAPRRVGGVGARRRRRAGGRRAARVGGAAAAAAAAAGGGWRRPAARAAAAGVTWLAAAAAVAVAVVAAAGSGLDGVGWVAARLIRGAAPAGAATPPAAVAVVASNTSGSAQTMWHNAFSTSYRRNPSAPTAMHVGAHATVGCAIEDALGCRGWTAGDCVPPANTPGAGAFNASAAHDDVDNSVLAWACPICERHAATSAACAAALEETQGVVYTRPASACPAVGAENVDARVPGCGERVEAAATAAIPISLSAFVVGRTGCHLFGERPLSWTLGWWWALAAGQGGVWLLCLFI